MTRTGSSTPSPACIDSDRPADSDRGGRFPATIAAKPRPPSKLSIVPVLNPSRLANHTTLRLGGAPERLVEARDRDELIDLVRSADEQGTPLLLVAGGSNLVVADSGFAGTAALVRSHGVAVVEDDDQVTVTVQAGHPWDDLVAQAVTEGWSGIECLAGIPGSTGATPVQNVGAYGQEISEVFVSAEVLDRHTGQVSDFDTAACRFGYRDSAFKHTDRYVVLNATYRLTKSSLSRPIRYAETATRLGVSVGDAVPLARAREVVLELRRGKGMVLDAADPDTYSAGSFFINPVITTAEFEKLSSAVDVEPPHWPSGDGIKVPAGWLIGRAGFEPGYGHDGVAISGKHRLALTNRGDGTTTALLNLAREIRDTVAENLGVTMRPEPTIIGAKL
ncbi:UDP-N-acetylmuramate dehydrogenase [Stackebrandtia endophytica]|uniref:UDP-N-acetylenolpyruvoylglucosamine reductase n=1 Tax=Stackebrandtia endophytica TaxID=1496996 RepID=A0A543AYD7_9ACTN|nr:UDP-N-acetylmuramate dehydrogenase [Stackebrandtia endophytica]